MSFIVLMGANFDGYFHEFVKIEYRRPCLCVLYVLPFYGIMILTIVIDFLE